MRAIGFNAIDIEIKRVLMDLESSLLGNFLLSFFDFGIVKLFDPAAL